MIIRVDWKLFKAVYFRVYKGYRVYCQLYNSLIEDVQSDGILYIVIANTFSRYILDKVGFK